MHQYLTDQNGNGVYLKRINYLLAEEWKLFVNIFIPIHDLERILKRRNAMVREVVA